MFYDEYEQARLWGSDQAVVLQEVFYKQLRWCIIHLSTAYIEKKWPTLEGRNAIARQIESFDKGYILPVTFDVKEIPGLPNLIGWQDGTKKTPEEIVQLFLLKYEVEP